MVPFKMLSNINSIYQWRLWKTLTVRLCWICQKCDWLITWKLFRLAINQVAKFCNIRLQSYKIWSEEMQESDPSSRYHHLTYHNFQNKVYANKPLSFYFNLQNLYLKVFRHTLCLLEFSVNIFRQFPIKVLIYSSWMFHTYWL